jgi:integrase
MVFKRCRCSEACQHPFWYAFVLNGIRYRKSTRSTNKQAAQRIATRRRAAVLEGRDEEDQPKVSLKDHINTYVEHTAKKNTTAYKDRAVLDRFATVVGAKELHEVSPFHIERWKSTRAESVSRSTVNRELNIIRGCFARGVEWGRLLQSSPLLQVKPYKVDDTRVRVLNDDELRLVLDADPWVALVCRVTLECLPRLSEVLGLRREHIGSSWIEVRRKGGSVERVSVTDDLRKSLLAQLEKDDSLFTFTRQAASKRVVRELRRLGIKGASHHTMRHTGVTLMLEAGVNPRVM